MRNSYELILASRSPRRRQLLAELGFSFTVQTKDTEETVPDYVAPSDTAAYLAEKKALAFRKDLNERQAVLAADTVVIVGEEILNKPADEQQATAMLQMLSGNTHRVVTGVCLMTARRLIVCSDTANVHFRPLTDEEIRYYVTRYRPFDKAGAYGIQEWIGMIGITKIEGSFFTVMGLPTHLVYDMIGQINAGNS